MHPEDIKNKVMKPLKSRQNVKIEGWGGFARVVPKIMRDVAIVCEDIIEQIPGQPMGRHRRPLAGEIMCAMVDIPFIPRIIERHLWNFLFDFMFQCWRGTDPTQDMANQPRIDLTKWMGEEIALEAQEIEELVEVEAEADLDPFNVDEEEKVEPPPPVAEEETEPAKPLNPLTKKAIVEYLKRRTGRIKVDQIVDFLEKAGIDYANLDAMLKSMNTIDETDDGWQVKVNKKTV